MKNKMLIIFIVISLLINNCFAIECVDKFCRTDDETMLIAAEKKFNYDQNNWVHKYKFSYENNCKYHLSSINTSNHIVYGPTLLSKYYIGDYFMDIFQHAKLMRKQKLKNLEKICQKSLL